MPNRRFGYKKKCIREEYNQQHQKETEDMDCNQYESNESFFWNLFLKTGRIDAYLLLKEEESENKTEHNT